MSRRFRTLKTHTLCRMSLLQIPLYKIVLLRVLLHRGRAAMQGAVIIQTTIAAIQITIMAAGITMV